MTAKFGGSGVIFSSGREVYAHWGMIGLATDLPRDAQFSVGGGFDQMLWRSDDEPTEDSLSKNDLAELADLMIETWTKFKESLR